jgi:hypothetical protein
LLQAAVQRPAGAAQRFAARAEAAVQALLRQPRCRTALLRPSWSRDRRQRQAVAAPVPESAVWQAQRRWPARERAEAAQGAAARAGMQEREALPQAELEPEPAEPEQAPASVARA